MRDVEFKRIKMEIMELNINKYIVGNVHFLVERNRSNNPVQKTKKLLVMRNTLFR